MISFISTRKSETVVALVYLLCCLLSCLVCVWSDRQLSIFVSQLVAFFVIIGCIDYFKADWKYSVLYNGSRVPSSLDALMVLLFHQMCLAAEKLQKQKSDLALPLLQWVLSDRRRKECAPLHRQNRFQAPIIIKLCVLQCVSPSLYIYSWLLPLSC